MSRSFSDIVRAHAARYPQMQPQDYVKLAYQNAFGPEHLVAASPRVLEGLQAECLRMAAQPVAADTPQAESIGNGLCRFHLGHSAAQAGDLPLLARFFVATARSHRGNAATLADRLHGLASLDVPGMQAYLAEYRQLGCPPVHHSAAFCKAYQPHYRVIAADFAHFLPVCRALAPLADGRPAIVAIDGRCGSGKSSLAQLLAQIFPCHVFHMDDFFLPFEKRSAQRLATPGGNVDHERLRAEVLEPLRRGDTLRLRAYNCHTGRLAPAQPVPFCPLNIVEGSYAQHPALADCYDLRLFLTCTPATQQRRLRAREGQAGLQPFLTRWIPLEEQYFSHFQIPQNSDLLVDTTDFSA